MGAWTEIADVIVESTTTNVVVNIDPAITKDDFIKVVATFINPTSFTSIRIFPNSNTTNTNFHRQLVLGNGSTVIASRGNVNRSFTVEGNNNSSGIAYIKISENNRYNSFTNSNQRNDGTIYNIFDYCTQSAGADTTTITSLTFSSQTTNAIGTGSRIQIYRLDAEKVADITTTSNATQVDISDLSIGKDSEYLLVSDFIPNTSSSSLHFLTPNDLTTQTNYHMQEINGSGSSAGRGRSNNARIAETRNTNNTLAYTHIKLSEIGAFTAQSYEIRQAGTANIILTNYFVSSTAENITSITKLNVGSSVSNQIKSGSRFILYKLK